MTGKAILPGLLVVVRASRHLTTQRGGAPRAQDRERRQLTTLTELPPPGHWGKRPEVAGRALKESTKREHKQEPKRTKYLFTRKQLCSERNFIPNN